eukprot:TRINITY_DN7782_c0_g1_i1.p1 TRINITY_DN7782_c0_g1~~TRINITY_DN7782_c0_g1_i1.p1  ORF type:complete len:195 (+),score=31.87 TRINITY_DN7782_c0_g1_i1:866-1450(+)
MLFKMVVFQVNSNWLNGSIPSSLKGCSSLQFLHLYENNITGTIPPEIGTLEHLTEFTFGNNQINGSLPSSISDSPVLRFISGHHNNLTGTLPNELVDDKTTLSLELHYNQLTGTIPSNFGNLSLISNHLFLNNNSFNGSVPIFFKGVDPQNINLNCNDFTLPLPDWCVNDFCSPCSQTEKADDIGNRESERWST